MINSFCLSNPGKTTPYDLELGLQSFDHFNWYIVPIFVILFYVVWKNIREKRFSVVFGGVAFWLWDVFNETWNSMVYATTGQPVWGTTTKGNGFQILIGYNLEISLMFMFLGMATCYMLETTPAYEFGLSKIGQRNLVASTTLDAGYGNYNFWDGNKDAVHDPNNLYYQWNKRSKDLTPEERAIKRKAIIKRWLVITLGSISAVIIEIILNALGLLTWEKPWWQPNFPFILFLIGYVPFFVCAVVIHDAPRKWQIGGLLIELAIVLTLLIVAGSLGMLGHQITWDAAGNWEWTGKWLRDGVQLIGK